MILEDLKTRSGILIEAQQAKLKTHPVATIGLFILLYIIGFVGAGILMAPWLIIDMIQSGGGTDILESDNLLLVQNFALIAVIAAFFLYCKLVEKRSAQSVGFVKRGALKQYLRGSLLGLLMISLSLGIGLLSGTMAYEGIILSVPWWIILLWLLGFMVQGMSEEVALRGYAMVSLSNRMPVVWAILITSIVFGALHAFNSSFSWLAMVNLILYGIFASLYFLHTNNIWAVGAHHSIWNWAQGNLYGVEVSGMKVDATVFRFSSTGSNDLISGGGFGLEGGLAATLIISLAILYLVWKELRIES